MKLLIFFTLVFTLQVSAKSFGQKVTLSANNSPLEKLFKEVKKQTGFTFVYTREQLKNSLPVTIHVKNSPLKDFLSICFKNQPLSFIIEDNYVVVQSKTTAEKLVVTADSLIDIKGKVVNENGEPLIGATVLATQTNKVALTNAQGEFSLTQINQNDIISISNVGYISDKINLKKERYYLIKLKYAINSLDETIVKGYYSTSKKLNTGSVVKVSGEQITSQPISNPILGLKGLVPGLVITQNNGLPGSRFKALIRGQNSIQNGNSPLYIIDGVPFLSDNDALTQLNGMLANSPFNTLDPNNIESIEVLKDADATAIYGSRGANGVILITTKAIKTEKNTLSVTTTFGWGKISKMLDVMNTPQYLEMRKEAFTNDGVIPTISNAPDLVAWDQNRFTNWRDFFIGGTAHSFNTQIRYSGGSPLTKFSIGAGYNKETTIFPVKGGDKKSTADVNITHKSYDNKFSLTLNTSYGFNNSLLPSHNINRVYTTPPNNYPLKDSAGNFIWREAGFSAGNLQASMQQSSIISNERITANAVITYRPIKSFEFQSKFGYNKVSANQKGLAPIAAQDPAYAPKGASVFGSNYIKTWIIEPQVSYKNNLSNHLKLDALMGSSFQKTNSERTLMQGSGYVNDALLGSIAAAPYITSTNGNFQYNYIAFFGRIGLDFYNKYLLNITARRDGSTRFGPENRFANFGAVGAAWVFSQTLFIKKKLPFLSFGKLRGSVGITGNDQIGNYQFLDTYKGTVYAYQGQPGLTPTKLFNSNYSWEENRKLELAIELGFLKDKLSLNLNYYKNISDNQIIRFSLPAQTGFNDVLMNFPGKLANSGYELSLNAALFSSKNFQWNSAFNISTNKNILVAFPDLASSSYATNYIIGKSLNAYQGLHYTGVNPQTGIYEFEDFNKDGSINNQDFNYYGNTDPKYFGGFSNSFTYKGISLNVLMEFRKQLGRDLIYSSSGLAGDMINQPAYATNRWQKPGDIKPFQKYTNDYSSLAYLAYVNLQQSDKMLTDASYLRLSNILIAYNLPSTWLNKFNLTSLKFFGQLQNFLTLSNYKGYDPEVQSSSSVPPLKNITLGLQANF